MSLKLVRRPRLLFWIIRGSIRGSRVEESSGTSDKREAEAILAKRRQAEIVEEVLRGRPASTTFAECVVSYLETGGRHGTGGSRRFMELVLDDFGTTPIAKIGLDEIEKGARVTYPKATPATRNWQFIMLSVAVLQTRGGAGMVPTAGHEAAQSPGRRGAVVEAGGSRSHDRDGVPGSQARSLIFLLDTGARVGEALWLDWQYVDLALRTRVLRQTQRAGELAESPLLAKNDRRACKPRAPRRGDLLDGRPAGHMSGRTGSTTRAPGAGSRKALRELAAVPGSTISASTIADILGQRGTMRRREDRCDLAALKTLGGWKSETMVLRYAHINVEQLRAHTIAALPGGRSGGQPWGLQGLARRKSLEDQGHISAGAISLGKGEVHSSILCGSTSYFPVFRQKLAPYFFLYDREFAYYNRITFLIKNASMIDSMEKGKDRVINSQSFHDGKVVLYQFENCPRKKWLCRLKVPNGAGYLYRGTALDLYQARSLPITCMKSFALR